MLHLLIVLVPLLLEAPQRGIRRHGRLLVIVLITAVGLFLVVRGIVRLLEAA